MKKEGLNQGILLLLLTLLTCCLLLPKLLHITPFVVESSSMTPTFSIGTLVYSQPIAFNELKVGDVITFKEGSNYLTHRVRQINKKEQTLRTKGDASLNDDLFAVPQRAIVGKIIFSLPYLGYLSLVAKKLSATNILSILVLISLICLLTNKKTIQ